MNLVMIGSFKELSNAQAAKLLIEEIIEEVRSEQPKTYEDDPNEARFSPKMLDFLIKANLMTVGPAELDQFQYYFDVQQHGSQIVLTTDEADVSAFLKIMLDKGAKIEIYSAHDYPDTIANDGSKLGR